MFGVLYPGQGSQHIGMGRFLFEEFAIARHTFEEASDTLNLDFKKLCFEGPESDLNLTENTQPCLLLTSVVTYRTLNELVPLKPTAAAGHSIGEYAALVNSGVINFTDAIRAVRKRGEFMQSAVPVGKGGMIAAMGLTPEQAQEVCKLATKSLGGSDLVEPANFNAPGQIVLSGSQPCIEWIQNKLKPEMLNNPPSRLRFIPLKVSAPFHCSLMKPAEEKMRAVLEDLNFENAQYPIVQNVTAQLETKGTELREQLIRQISAPVRWVECVTHLKNKGLSTFIECGSGKVLSGLVKKIIEGELTVLGTNSIEDLKAIESQLQ